MRKTSTVAKVPFLAPDVITKVIPAPVDGWDAISPLAEMDPKRAPILKNWVPRPGYIELRGGYNLYASTTSLGDSGGTVESLMVFKSPTQEMMFAAANNNIYNVSSGIHRNLTGFSNNRFQYVNFTNSAGSKFLIAVNGTDPMIQFDGQNWTQPSIDFTTDAQNNPTGLDNITTSSVANISFQKQRLWFVLNNSTIIVFMPVGSNSGPIAGFQDLGQLWNKGGQLIATADWTIDGGSGPQDYIMFLSNRGQVSLYSGTDPTNASAWNLVGTFDVSPPIGERCVTRIGSDVAIITQAGVVPISQALPFDPSSDRSVAITARIQNAMAQAALAASGNFGWEFSTFPAQQLAILNVPQIENQSQTQFVMNTLTGAWCQFTGWNANTFAVYQNDLYWGGNDGSINQGYTGGVDYQTSIFADMQCAFNWLDEPGRTKRMTMVQPLLTVGSGITPTLAIDADFTTSTSIAPITTFQGTVLWDNAIWDFSQWPALSQVFDSWLTVNAIGHALAIRMQVNIAPPTASTSSQFDIATFDVGTFGQGFDVNLPILQVNAFNCIAEMGGAI